MNALEMTKVAMDRVKSHRVEYERLCDQLLLLIRTVAESGETMVSGQEILNILTNSVARSRGDNVLFADTLHKISRDRVPGETKEKGNRISETDPNSVH